MAAFTEKVIVEIFISLLNEKPLDKITVKDIIDKCGVNRSTFYYYFEDVFDLLNSILENEAKKIADAHIEHDKWQDGILEAMKFALDNRKAIMHIYNSSSNRDKLERYLNNIFRSVIRKAVMLESEGLSVAEEDIDLIADVYHFTLIGLTYKWSGGGMKDEPVDVVQKLSYLLDGNMRQMLERAIKYKK